MNANQLLNNERIISQSGNGSVILTTHRIRFFRKEAGKANIISMFLVKIASIEVDYKSNYLIWVFGVISILIGLYFLNTEDFETFIVLSALGVILIIAYYNTRRHIITVTSDGASKMTFRTKGMHTNELVAFINQIEKAKVDLL